MRLVFKGNCDSVPRKRTEFGGGLVYGKGSCDAFQPPPTASISATLDCKRVDRTPSAVCSALRRVVCAVITLL